VVAPAHATEPIEVDMLENPLLLADIEALYEEIEAEELEPEEPIEPGYGRSTCLSPIQGRVGVGALSFHSFLKIQVAIYQSV